MATTEVTSWAVDLSTLGPIYPFVGTEMLWLVLGLAFWIAWHIWQIRSESRVYREDLARLRSPADIEAALEGHRLRPPGSSSHAPGTADAGLAGGRLGAD